MPIGFVRPQCSLLGIIVHRRGGGVVAIIRRVFFPKVDRKKIVGPRRFAIVKGNVCQTGVVPVGAAIDIIELFVADAMRSEIFLFGLVMISRSI
jgi:hypothetical protein